MTLLSPLALLWLASIPVLLWLWRLSSTHRQTHVPSLIPFEHLLKRSPTRRNRLFVNLLFWLQLAALSLVAAALAKPVLFQRPATTTLVVVDTSASMAARLNGTSAFERARRLLRARLARKTPADMWFIVASAPVATLMAQATSDSAQLQAAIERLSINEMGGNLATAAHLGRALLGHRVDVMLVVTDEPRPESLASHEVEFLTVGEPHANVAIVGIDAQGAFCADDPARLLVTVQNFADAPATIQLSAEQPGRRLTGAWAALSPRGRTTISLTLPEEIEGWVTATLEAPRDALGVDNQAQVLVRRSSTRPIAVLSDDAGFQRLMGRWLNACDGLAWTIGPPASASGPYLVVTDREDASTAGAVGVLHFLGHAPSSDAVLAHWIVSGDHEIASYLPDVNLVAASVGSMSHAALVGQPILWGLLEGQRMPLVIAAEHEGRRSVSCLLDPTASADATALLVVFFNSLRWLMGQANVATTGEPLVVSSLEPGTVAVHRPNGQIERISHAGGTFRYEATTHAGRYRILQGGVEEIRAVNFLDPRESDVMQRASTWQPTSPQMNNSPIAPRASRPLTNTLLLFVLILCLLEWWLYCTKKR